MKAMPVLEEFLTKCLTLELLLFNLKVTEGGSDEFYRAIKHIPKCYLLLDVSSSFLEQILNKNKFVENYCVSSTLSFDAARWKPWTDEDMDNSIWLESSKVFSHSAFDYVNGVSIITDDEC
jgi:hypothetical protein